MEKLWFVDRYQESSGFRWLPGKLYMLYYLIPGSMEAICLINISDE